MSATDFKSVYFVSLGCPKNLVDSQVMLGALEKDQFTLSQDPSQADVIIVNTRSFIQAAKEESIETILEMARYKDTGSCKVLAVSGCLPQRYSGELKKEMPEIDLLIGTGQYHRITEFLSEIQDSLKMGAPLPQRVYVDQPAFIHSEKDLRVQTGPAYTAYLKLSEGCNRRCSFCIIPSLRGFVRSRTVESLVTEATQLAQRGVKELNLVAQDLTHYGIDTHYRENIDDLLRGLVKIEGIEWIRLHYVYPDQLKSSTIKLIATEPKIAKYLDMPIQHTSDRILKLMNRRLTKARLFNLIDEIREQVPEVVFRTSIIVGFPGETEQDFAELCEDLSRLSLDYVGVFRYSKEESTPAGQMEHQVHPATKRKREKQLIKILQEKALGKFQKRLGATVAAVVEGPSQESEALLQARLVFQAPEIDGRVLINDFGPGISGLKIGDLVNVELTECMDYDYIGRVVGSA